MNRCSQPEERPSPPLAGCRSALVVLLFAAPPMPGSTATFDLAAVAAKAEKLAAESYREPEGIPDWLAEITYDQWRDIRFRPEHTLWRKESLPFQLQLFHPGFYYNRTVVVNIVDRERVEPLAFSPAQFDYGRNDFAASVPAELGYAGFRVHAPINTPKYYDEVIVFLGASYFRAVGKGQVFGLSARGLAIDTALPSGEEFPYFREFWIVRPHAQAKSLTVYALLDSPSLTGAYELAVTPGRETVVDVSAVLYLRRHVRKLGLAPLTSMFFHGENTVRFFDDFRPEVHDSDGLLLHLASGEWLWRPLDNPRTLNVSAFRMPNPRGFGVMQRDRAFDHYQDLETRRELRPGAWVVPQGEWGDGHAELVEIPTKSDTNDNIVAFWVPRHPPEPGRPFRFSYRMHWSDQAPARKPDGHVVATRRDRGNVEDAYRFVVDFHGEELKSLPADTILRAVVSIASNEESADLLDQHVVKNPVTGGWRLTFQVRPKRKGPIELRAFLDKGTRTLTETWSYVLLP